MVDQRPALVADAAGQVHRCGRRIAGARGDFAVGLADGAVQRFGVEQDGLDGMPHDVVVRPGACLGGLQAVALHQQRRAVLHRRVEVRIARREDLHEEFAFAVDVAQRAVGGHQVAVGRHALVEFGYEAVAHPGAGRFGDVLVARHVPGDVVLKIGAVGDVVIDQEIGHPGVENVQPGAHFGRVGLDVVAVQVEPLGGVAEAGGCAVRSGSGDARG